MVTNYPQQLAATIERAQHALAVQSGVMARMASRLGQTFCGLSGHEAVMHFEGKRVMMRCTSCGYDTPGWEIGDRGPRRRFDGDAERHLLVPERRLVLKKSA
jgi:hypothetical protein